MKKRLFLVILAMIAFVLPSNAVLKEANLDTTMYILRSELSTYHLDLEHQDKSIKHEQEMMREELMSIYKQSNQISVMLYSQKSGYIFDMAYACNEAAELYRSFKKKTAPIRRRIAEREMEVARFDSLIDKLSTLQTGFLTTDEKKNRDICLTLAVNIRRQLKESQEQQKNYIEIYDRTENDLKGLNDYAQLRYADIQNSIFNNKGDGYLKILLHIGENFNKMRMAVSEKYKPIGKITGPPISQWDVRIIGVLFFIIGIYMFISIFINVVTIRLILTRLVKIKRFNHIEEKFLEKRRTIMMAMTMVTFAILLAIVRATFDSNFIKLSSSLLINYAWLQGVILFSLLIRVNGKQINNAFHIYLPLLVVTFLVIAFRIVLIPNALLVLIFPPLLILCSLWQLHTIWRLRNDVPKIDLTYSYLTLGVFVASVIAALMGYTLLSVLLLIWWTMLLTCILSLTCLRDWMTKYAEDHDFANKAMRKIWFHRLIVEVLIPVIGVLSILISIYYAADVFNLSETSWEIFTYKLNLGDVIQISLLNLIQVINMWIIFKYINSTVCDFLKHKFKKIDPSTADSRFMMTKNVMQVIIWGLWLLVSIKLCNISSTWFVYVSTGLSTGIGFAMKDILENIYYGVSLMAGRIKIGDYIICDGIRGRVSKISYTSTMIDAVDGSVIAFQNSQLFTKNYKNMTRNHGYELHILEVGVAYGTNIAEVKKLLIDELNGLDCIFHEKGVKVVLKSFDDSCITLKILVWVNVLTQAADDGKIMETIYNLFEDNNIEIPFPQREITIKNGNSDGSGRNLKEAKEDKEAKDEEEKE